LFPLEDVAERYKNTGSSRECLRQGTRKLFLDLKSAGQEVWVYTFSFRTCEEIKCLFDKYDIKLDGIINYRVHKKRIEAFNEEVKWLKKYPPAFDIDVLIDDLLEIKNDGDRYGFKVILLDEKDTDWVKTIKHNLLSDTNPVRIV
ncbi:MAG: hypothetical protein AAF740_07180, partial [Bacteroidota bacterium]